ncbi:MAG: hypothetical protein IT463_07445 [Planctomycetes bacterium]|nr:hypothetical protein [Planctomycetota bacterium]
MEQNAANHDERNAALARRKDELEAELDAYAAKGVVSPGLLKAARWVSRGLWMALCVLVVVLLVSGWGKVSRETYDEAVKSANKQAERARNAERQLEDVVAADLYLRAQAAAFGVPNAESAPLLGVVKGILDASRADAEQLQHSAGPLVLADRAGEQARSLLLRARLQRTQAHVWRMALAPAGDAAAAAADLRRCASATESEREEILRNLPRHGAEALAAAGREALLGEDPVTAARLLALLGRRADVAMLDRFAAGDVPPLARREALLARSLLALDGEGEAPAAPARFEAEAWVASAVAGDAAALAEAYRKAPDESKLELLALLAETAGTAQRDLFAGAATSRPAAERIVAIRWAGARKDGGSRELLAGLAAGKDDVAAEAARALARLEK